MFYSNELTVRNKARDEVEREEKILKGLIEQNREKEQNIDLIYQNLSFLKMRKKFIKAFKQKLKKQKRD